MGFLPAGRGGGVQRETLEYGLAGTGADTGAGTDVADCASSRDAPTRPATRADAEAARIARVGVARDERFTGDRIIVKWGARRETGWSFGARRPNLSLTCFGKA